MDLLKEMQDLTKEAEKNEDKIFHDIKNVILDDMRKVASNGSISISFDITSLVKRYGEDNTNYSDMANKLERYFTGEGFIVSLYSVYKEESIKIDW